MICTVRGVPCVAACNEEKLEALQLKSNNFFELVSICVPWDLKHADNELLSR